MARIRLVARPDHLTPYYRSMLDGLDLKCFPEDEPYEKDGCYWWVAFDGPEPVAFAGLKPLTGQNGGLAFLCRAGVLRSARGQGLQKRLIRVRLARARAAGLSQVLTYTHPLNFESASNLLKCGMRFHEPPFEWGCKGAMYFSKSP